MELKIHNIHPYHGKFYYGIPKYFIEKYGKNVNSILDPFCGSGTTLIEASMANINSVGVDINFLSCKISEAKISKIDLIKLDNYFNKIINSSTLSELNFPDSNTWFTEENFSDLCRIKFAIDSIDKKDYKNIFEVILSSVLKTASNKREVWNNAFIADNLLPNLPSKQSLRKVFIAKYKKFRDAYTEYHDYPLASSRVIHSDILKYRPKKLFDMVITSPPYPFAVDFAKYNRLSYYLFNENLDEAVEKETGARSKRNKRNCVEDFFDEIEKLYIHIMSLVKINGYACMTVGDTHRNNKKIQFVEWLIKLFEGNNWELVEDIERELKKQSMPQKRIPVEHILIFRRLK